MDALFAECAPTQVVNNAAAQPVQPLADMAFDDWRSVLSAGHAHYATSKAGLIMFTRAAALEYGPRGVRVNCVSPGLVDRAGLADDWPDGVGRWQERVPLGRLGTAKDVADAVLFLLSPAARWISGTNLVVDGGMSAQSRW